MARLETGLKAETSFTVEEKHLATEVGSGRVRVFATAMMIGGMESAAVQAVQDALPPSKTTVGTHVDVAHKASTPMGMQVRFEARLEQISHNGKGLRFSVQAFDECGLIGEGTHERVIIDKEPFEARANMKIGGKS